MDFQGVLKVLFLLAIANGTPVFVARLLGTKWAWPLDRGLTLADGRPLFGRSKTIRGFVSGVLATGLAAPLVGASLLIGASVGTLAMAGDLLSSFIKRRQGLQSSSRATGLDQIPESLLPTLAALPAFELGLTEAVVIVLLFLGGSIVLSWILYHLDIKNQPY